MAALGMRTSIGAIIAQGWRPMALLASLSGLLVVTAMATLILYSS